MPLSKAIECADVIDQSRCVQLNGCSWSSSCSGVFSPLCTSNNCYYIDGMTLSSNPDGTAANPFQTLTDGLNEAASTGGTLIVINNLDSVSVAITGIAVIDSNVTIV